MIHVNEEKLEFHLTNGKVSYIFRVMEETGVLEHLYTGKAVGHRKSFTHLIEREVRPSNNLYEGNLTTSLEHIRQEMPVFGTTDFRDPALSIRYEDGDRISHFSYLSYEIQKGKEKLQGMPHTFFKEEEAKTLVIHLKDRYENQTLSLFYTITEKEPVILRHSELKNHGEEPISLERLMSFSLDLPRKDFDFIHLTGAWAREAQLERKPLHTGIQRIGSVRGASSHMHNPFFALADTKTTEHTGEVFGFSFIYSGNFLAQVEVDSYQVTRAMLGIHPHNFEWNLKPGETFVSPEAVMVYSNEGLGGMSRVFHDLYREHLISTKWAKKERPILMNNWEGTYFDFDEEKIVEIAKQAKDLGVELFVLDDGWFGKRDSDNSSLGNWTPDERKLPNGIKGLSEKIRNLGLKFGLWFEPEMVSKDTDLFKEHPDWILGHPKKNISHGRNQFVLDMGNQMVVDELFRQMDDILSVSELSYVKWDMNRYISEAYSQNLSPDSQGEVMHRYILGVYELFERILTKYPDLFIESCAGGGGRFDPGMLYYSPQVWTSDDTDAVERLKIQYGTSMVYPISSIGSHVSAVPNHQVARLTSLKMRGDVALFGTSGYELDPIKLTEEEKIVVREQIRVRNARQKLLLEGDFIRLSSPYESNRPAWMVVSKDQSEALVGIYQVLAKPNPPYERLQLRGLIDDGLYEISGSKEMRLGDDLMNIGLLFGENYIGRTQEYWSREMPGDFSSRIVHLSLVHE